MSRERHRGGSRRSAQPPTTKTVQRTTLVHLSTNPATETSTRSGVALLEHPPSAVPTPEQRAAIAVVRRIGTTQAAELALRQYLRERIAARSDVLADAYHALHVAYGGKAPLAVTWELEVDYYSILGDAPDGVDGAP